MSENLLHQLMSDYAEREGAQLRKELNTGSANVPTSGLDKKIRRGLFKLKYRVHVRAAVAVAACLALALLLPPILQQQTRPDALVPPIAAPAPAAAEGALPVEAFGSELARIEGDAEAQIAFDAASDGLLPQDFMPDAQNEYALPFVVDFDDIAIEWYGYLDPELVGGRGAIEPPPNVELSFELPEGFELVDAFSWHDGTGSSYLFSLGLNRTIGLNIDYHRGFWFNFDGYIAEGDPSLLSRMNRTQLNGHTIYYDREPERSQPAVVLFTAGDHFYQLSGCAYTSVEDLLLLAEAIIRG